MELHGIFPAVTTPFDGDGPALDRLRENLERYAPLGLGGYLVLGSTAEAVLLDDAERGRILDAARRAIPPAETLMVGVSAEATCRACARAAEAADRGADCVLVSTPHYFRDQMTVDALLRHFAAVADAAPVPVLLYNVPKFTGLELPLEVVRRVSLHPNVAGIKESSGDPAYLQAILDVVPRRSRVFCGAASILDRALRVGAVGGILAVAAALPEPLVRLAGTSDDGTTLDAGLAEAAAFISGRCGIPGVKAAMDVRGLHGGPVRPPLQPVSPRTLARIGDLVGLLAERGVIERVGL